MDYIRPPKAYSKLKQAHQDLSPVVISASTGWGKTSLIRHYYKHINTHVLSGKSGKLNDMTPPDAIRPNTIIIDDAGWIFDQASIEYMETLIRDKTHQVVILTRSDYIPWLLPLSFEFDFTYINESDLALNRSLIADLLNDTTSVADADDIAQIFELSRGFPIAIELFHRHLEIGEPLDQRMTSTVVDEMYAYFDATTFCLWPEDVRQFLLATCRFRSFTTKMAEMHVPGANAHQLIDYCRRVGSFLHHGKDNTWTCRKELRYFLKHKQLLTWTQEEISNSYRLAGDYYSQIGDLSSALEYYEHAGSQDDVRECLLRNAELHPGIGQYYELRDYYDRLPDELTMEHPLLMLGKSFMYSITMRPDLSDRWYNELVSYAASIPESHKNHKAAKAYVAYLDFSLPHKKRKSLEKIIKNASILASSHDLTIPRSSITGNQPSVMNGGLDVCEWSKRDTFIAKMLKIPFSRLMGDDSAGLINTGLAESGYEKNTLPSEKILSLLSDAYTDAFHNGTMDMCFAIEGVLIKYHVTSGDMQTAAKLLSTFKQTMYTRNARHLEDNVLALEARLALFTGDSKAIEAWLRKSPDEKTDFCTLDRYIYMTKLRCLIATGQLHSALSLSTYMQKYISEYNRVYLKIENNVLRSIILHGLGSDEWKSSLLEALTQAEDYHFLWVIAIHGKAIISLLEELFKEQPDMKTELSADILRAAKRMALRYPGYLEHSPDKLIILTDREEEILGYLCRGLSTSEICEACNLSYSGLKKHNRSIYAKLDVKNRVEAERVASRLGLVHRTSDTDVNGTYMTAARRGI